MIELDGQVAEVQASAERAEQLCRHAGARGLRLAQDPTECAVLWKGRKSAFSAVGKITPTYYVQDGVVPRSSLPSVLGRHRTPEPGSRTSRRQCLSRRRRQPSPP